MSETSARSSSYKTHENMHTSMGKHNPHRGDVVRHVRDGSEIWRENVRGDASKTTSYNKPSMKDSVISETQPGSGEEGN